MILSSAYALILGLNLIPAQHAAPPAFGQDSTCTRPIGPSQPVSLAVGDALGRQMMASQGTAIPPALAARRARIQLPAVAWTVMPGESGAQLALTR